MEEVINLNGKRVCDISSDRKTIEILQKGCRTRITVGEDGTLDIRHIYAA